MCVNRILVFTILVSFILSGCGEENTTKNPVTAPSVNTTAQSDISEKICLLFNEGNLGDKGFNDSQYSAAAKVQMAENFQLIIVTGQRNTLYESFQKAINMECNLLVATEGYAMKNSVLEFAPKYPETKFILMDEKIYSEYPNLTTTHFKTAEAAYLAGILAADMSTSGVLGIVAGLDVPAVKDFQVGLADGGVSISPMLYSKHLIPQDTLNKIADARKSIIDGDIKVVSAWDEIKENDD